MGLIRCGISPVQPKLDNEITRFLKIITLDCLNWCYDVIRDSLFMYAKSRRSIIIILDFLLIHRSG